MKHLRIFLAIIPFFSLKLFTYLNKVTTTQFTQYFIHWVLTCYNKVRLNIQMKLSYYFMDRIVCGFSNKVAFLINCVSQTFYRRNNIVCPVC